MITLASNDAPHATLSASSAERWMSCPGSVAAEQAMEQQDTSSEFALEGTAAHALAERCHVRQSDARDYLGHTINERFIVCDEMADAVQQYLDYCREHKGYILIEQRVSFEKWVPEGFGTSDYSVVANDTLSVIDLKYGKGVRVFAKNNKQLMLYALGVLNEYDFLLNIKEIKVAIVQPRLDHIDEWTLSLDDLLAFGAEAKTAADKALSEDALRTPTDKGCLWCAAKPTCRELATHAMTVAAEGFTSIVTPIRIKNLAALNNAEIAEILPQIDLIKGWTKSLETYATDQLSSGKEIPGYKLVEGRSTRKWRDEDAAEKALKSKLKVADRYTKKLISPTQAEKKLGKKHPILDKHVIKPPGKPTLAQTSDTRHAINLSEGFTEVA